MHLLFTVLVTFFAGMGAGLGTGCHHRIIANRHALQNSRT